MKTFTLLAAFLLALLTAGCDMGTPAPSPHISKRDRMINELAARDEYFKVITVVFKDGTYYFLPVTRSDGKDWFYRDGGKSRRLSGGTPEEIAREIYGKRVETAHFANAQQ